MSAQANQNNNENNNRRGRGRGNGKATPAASPAIAAVEPTAASSPSEEVCWICAEPIKYYALPACNHRTCHVCSLRLRALYKKMDCTFCKEGQPTMIITSSATEVFSAFTPLHTPFSDPKLAMFFEDEEMMNETLFLLRFNCPAVECDYVGTGWADLKLHARAAHGLVMCDLCIRSKKIFAHEHLLYPPSQLPLHLPSLARRGTNNSTKAKIEGGTHPLCEFCRECFFGDDELYAHMREKHEECFVCKRDGVRDQYFTNYAAMETHFTTAHYPCTEPACLTQKFVVFSSPLDLKAHAVEAHGGEMSRNDPARKVVGLFEFESRASGSGRGRGGHAQQPQQARVQVQPQPPGGSRRREAFGGSLTTVDPPPPPNRSTPVLIPEDDATERYLTRLSTQTPDAAISSVRAALRSYKAHESSARDLVSVLWGAVGEELQALAGGVNSLVDTVFEDDETKKSEVLAAWRGFEVEQRRNFPDLVPTLAGSSTSSRYAAVATGKIMTPSSLKKKPNSRQSSGQVWDRVAQAAASTGPGGRIVPGATGPSSRFPPLKAVGGPTPTPARGAKASTPWSSASAASGSSTAFPAISTSNPNSRPSSRNASNNNNTTAKPKPGPKLTNPQLFPELPSSANARQKVVASGNVSLKNILGLGTAPEISAWGAGSSTAPVGAEAASGPVGTGKGKKGKGKQKQTLFTLGSFPT